MKLEEIQAKFAQVVRDKALMKKIEATKYQLYYWRHPEKQETKVGTMLEVLWKVDMLSFKDIEIKSEEETISKMQEGDVFFAPAPGSNKDQYNFHATKLKKDTEQIYKTDVKYLRNSK